MPNESLTTTTQEIDILEHRKSIFWREAVERSHYGSIRPSARDRSRLSSTYMVAPGAMVISTIAAFAMILWRRRDLLRARLIFEMVPTAIRLPIRISITRSAG